MPRTFKGSETTMNLLVHTCVDKAPITELKIILFTTNPEVVFEINEGINVVGNIATFTVPNYAFGNMEDGVINYIVNGLMDDEAFITERQSNYYLKTPTNYTPSEGGDCPELIEITITNNGIYEGAFGKVVVDVPQEELEEINITENGIYEGAYDRVIVDVPQEAGDINPDTLREITITENGVYTSKYSTPIEKVVTGIFPDGSPFYGYGELNGIIYDTQINLNDIGVLESLEFWYKGDNIVVGDGWNIILASNSEDSANEGCVEFRYAIGNENYVRIGGYETSFILEEGVWHHFKLIKTDDYNCTLFVDDVEKESFPLPTATSTNFYINSSYYDANGDGWEGNRNANGCFGMIKIDDHTFVPTENGFINYNTQEPLPVVKAGDYSYNTTDIKLEGEPYKTINVDVQPNLASLDVTLTQNGSYNLSVEDGVDGYNRGTIVVDVPQNGGSCNLEPLRVAPNWQDRDESDYVNYQPSEGMNGFDSVHIDLYPVHEEGKHDGKQEVINGLGHLVATEQKTYTAQKETKTRKYIHFDGDDYFYNEYQSTAGLTEINLEFRYEDMQPETYLLGNETYYIKLDFGELSALRGGYYTNPISIPPSTWINVKFDSNGLSVTYDGNTITEPWIEGEERYPLLGGLIIGNNSLMHSHTNFYGDISTIEIHDGSNIEVYKPFPNGLAQGSFATLDGNMYENQGDGSATFGEESYEVGVDGWKSVEVNVDAGSIVAETARVLDITENGTYKSQYSEPTYPDAITGVYPNGENFYSYAQLTTKVFNTGIKLSEISKIEIWYKPKGTTLRNNGGIVGTNNTAFNIITATGAFSGKIGGTTRTYRLPFNNREKWYHIELSYDEGFVVDGVNYGTYTQTQLNQERLIWINKYNYSADGYFGMIKIDDTIIIPTADGFRNTNTGELLEVVTAGDYVFTEELPIYSEGNLIKTINVNVQPNLIPIDKTITKNGTYLFTKQEGMDGYSSGQVVVDVPQNKINIAEAGIKFGHSTFSSVPEWADFSNVTDMSNMFYECDNITTIPLIDTSNAITMLSMFAYCGNITTIPSINTSNVTEMRNMFYDCRKLTSIPLIDTSKVTDMRNMFYDCLSLTSIPQLDTSKVTDMWWMFNNCSNLTTIPQLDFSNVNNASGMFIYCTNLTNLGGFINLHDNLDISYSNKITRESILNIFNDMAVVTNRSIKLHEVVYSQLTEEDIAIATQKGWSVEIGK